MFTRRWLIPLVFLLAGCASGSEPVSPAVGKLEPGTYRYTGMTRDGVPILRGTLVLDFAEDTIPDPETDEGGACCHWTIAGSWTIGWIPGADTTLEVGPQVGSGELRGAILHGENEGRLPIDLNPGWADNNAGLSADRVGDGLTGEWGWTTITGPRTSGRFTAVRQ